MRSLFAIYARDSTAAYSQPLPQLGGYIETLGGNVSASTQRARVARHQGDPVIDDAILETATYKPFADLEKLLKRKISDK